jgi:cation diffusion facilitator CzcD-associated flavoprotein CzcO
MRCAIIGSGLAALASYATLRRRGIPAEDIVVFGVDEDPTTAWRDRAAAIRQQRMRSESDGHLAPAAFPGLALREAAHRASLAPVLASVVNRYHPSVGEFLSHADEVRVRSGWPHSFVSRRVGRIRAVDGGFELDGDGPFAHVLVATGHPGLARLPGTVHAYEPHDYAAKVAIVGAGMAAATEWRNALAAGSEVVSIRRREPLHRPLSMPREYFSKRGLAGYQRLGAADRVARLQDLGQPSYPTSFEPRSERFQVADSVPGTGGTRYQVIAATGFRKGYAHDPLLADLVEAHDLETHDRWITLAPDSTIPTLTDATRTLSLAGVAGQWAFPPADTIAGAKYAAHAFANRACRTR